jgi:D-3-phosphoglycerate dehydrogenase
MILRFPDATEAMAGLLAGPLAAILPGLQTDVAAPDPATLIASACDADGLLLMRTRVDLATMAALPRLKALAFLSTGIASWVDLQAAAASGIAVRGVRGYGDQSVAEHALALILSALRGVAAADRALREGQWIDQGGRELAGSRLAVIGLGGAGRALAALSHALGAEVVGWSRTPSSAATMLPLDACLATPTSSRCIWR